MSASNDPIRDVPDDQEPLEDLFGTNFDLAGQVASRISPDEIEARLRRTLQKAGHYTVATDRPATDEPIDHGYQNEYSAKDEDRASGNRSANQTTNLAQIATLHPRTYNEARTIGELFREGIPVIINLTEMLDSDAKRLVDFAAGLIFGLHGSIERVANKVFLLSPAAVEVVKDDKARIAERGFFYQSLTPSPLKPSESPAPRSAAKHS